MPTPPPPQIPHPSSPPAISILTRLVRAMPRPPAIVIAGPSGVGKGTLIARLRAEYPARVGFSISHTTRAPRPGEADGVDYHFVTRDAMTAGIAAGDFLESADVHGRFYGTSAKAVEDVAVAGKICVIEIDVQGCRLVRKRGVEAKFVFVAPPSVEELEKRLRGRATESEEDIVKRVGNAKGEMDAMKEEGLFDRVIVNNDLDVAYGELKDVLKDDLAATG